MADKGQQKIYKSGGEKPTATENEVAAALTELQNTSKDLATDLKDLYIVAAKKVGSEEKESYVVFYPFRQRKKFQKIQQRLQRELEKKFSGKHVTFVAQRTILSTNYSRQRPGASRPRSRTLTAVHNALLEDIAHPNQIVGKRLRIRTDGSRLLKIYLDPKDHKELEPKLKTFTSVYKSLTNKNVEFSFPPSDD